MKSFEEKILVNTTGFSEKIGDYERVRHVLH